MKFNRKVVSYLAVALVFLFSLMLLAGCAGKAGQTGTDVLDTIQQKICDPTPEEQATADNIYQVIASGVVVGGAFAGLNINKDGVLAVMNELRKGACVGVTELQQALAWFGAATSGAKAAIPDATPLYKMLKRAK